MVLNVNFYLESTKNRTEFLPGPAEKTYGPVTAPLLLQVEYTFFMNQFQFLRSGRLFVRFQIGNISVQVHQVCKPFHKLYVISVAMVT